MSEALLTVAGLTVSLPASGGAGGGRFEVVRDLSLTVRRGELLGLVGESGSGKTMTALALLGLLPAAGRVERGSVRLGGEELVGLPAARLRSLRGRRIAMIFQEPAAALNPVFTVGFQVAEAVRAHRRTRRRQARRAALELLERVGLPDARQRLDAYPHQLSGGQRQRVMIAMALAGGPELLLADEPTTALDVTVQAEILELLDELRRDLGLAVLLITHDLAVVAQSCDRVVVMYAGELVEEAPVEDLFAAPAHPYTRALLAASPRLDRRPRHGQLPVVPGQVPAPGRLPEGCAFHPRCAEVLAPCSVYPPPIYPLAEGRWARCFLHAPPGELPGAAAPAGAEGAASEVAP